MSRKLAPVIAALRRAAAREQRDRAPDAPGTLPRGGFERRAAAAQRRWLTALKQR
jgi:hypothetical protein